MKSILIILSSLVFLFACGGEGPVDSMSSEEASPEQEVDRGPKIIEGFDCETFFKSGDYSTLCFVDGKLPKFGGSACIIAFETNGDKQMEGLILQFVNKKSTMLAEMHLNLSKGNYAKGKVTDVKNVGDAAFIDVYGTDLGSLSISNKDLHVRYKNITFKLMAEYRTSVGEPCFSSDKEMIAFAKMIIDNF